MSRPRYEIDKDATLDYSVDLRWQTHNPTGLPKLGDWLATGETVSSYAVTPGAGLELVSQQEDDGLITAWVSVAAGTAVGELAALTFSWTSTDGRTDERSIDLLVSDR